MNMRTLVDRLQRLGVASRAELAKSLHMSAPTAGKIADALLRLGVLEEVGLEENSRSAPSGPGNEPARLGRPGRLLRLDRSRPRFVGIELGVTHTSLALLPVGVDTEDQWTHQFQTSGTAEEWAHRLTTASAGIGPSELWGVLVSVPGIVDEQAGRVLFSANLHWTEKADLLGLVQHLWDAPAILVQEERALALGHKCADPKAEDFLLVDIGEGVGGAAIVSGRLYAPPLSISGELGHTPVLGNKRRCGCGGTGCVETLLSTRGLVRSLAEAHGELQATWEELSVNVGSSGIEPWLAETLDAAGVVIAGALNVLGLRRVIITGSLAELAPGVIRHLSSAILNGVMWARFGSVEVESAPRRRMAGLVAAAIDRLVLPRVNLKRTAEAAEPAFTAREAF